MEADEASLRVPIYYCHPYCAWEKGSVERHNRLLRTYNPKPTDFSKLSPHALRQTRHHIVHYPAHPERPPAPCASYRPSPSPCAILLTFYRFGEEGACGGPPKEDRRLSRDGLAAEPRWNSR